MIVEICANSFESALAAQEGGARRIELCSELSVGGLTPSYGLLKKVLNELTIPVHVLIRPRSGDFSYTPAEMDIMLADIALCKELGCDGVVSGVLNTDNTIDMEAIKLLIKEASTLQFTFHRAFDWVMNPLKALDQLKELKVHRLLTSGQKNSAVEGIELLKELKTRSEDILEIMPGGGINYTNASLFKSNGFSAIHLSATTKHQTLSNKLLVSMHNSALFEEGIVPQTDSEMVRNVVDLVKK